VLLPQATPAPGKGQKAARDFEAQLIGTVLESLEKTFAALPGQEQIPGQDDYNYLGTQALASAVAAKGGFGIARMISSHLEDTKVATESAHPSAPASTQTAKVPVKPADGTR
jgi:Rod binding domain-containing protein